VVLVSHDRYFIDNLATRIFEIEEGHVHVYPGNYEDYLWRKGGGHLAAAAQTSAAPVAAVKEPEAPAEQKKRINPMKLKKLQDDLAKAEADIARLESEIAQDEAALADYKSAEESMRLSELLTKRRGELEARVAQWETISEELEANS
jgi:ATP-binding cassette subfamily F protein 3